MKNVKILVCCHKKDVMATEEPYMPIHVGKALHPDVDLGIQGDDTGDNISLKNGSYCELTGMYWAWKNLKDVDVIGLCHYRRYFDFHGQCRRLVPQEIFRTKEFNNINLTIPESVLQNLKKGEAIVQRRKLWMTSLYVVYCTCFMSQDVKKLRNVVIEKYPDYIESYDYIMYKQNKKSQANMFIMTWQDFDDYCTWLFDILFEVENRINISNYSPFQARIYGFMSEFLLNVWLHKNKILQIRKPVIWFDDMHERPSVFSVFQRGVRGWLATEITKPRRGEIKSEVQ